MADIREKLTRLVLDAPKTDEVNQGGMSEDQNCDMIVAVE